MHIIRLINVKILIESDRKHFTISLMKRKKMVSGSQMRAWQARMYIAYLLSIGRFSSIRAEEQHHHIMSVKSGFKKGDFHSPFRAKEDEMWPWQLEVGLAYGVKEVWIPFNVIPSFSSWKLCRHGNCVEWCDSITSQFLLVAKLPLLSALTHSHKPHIWLWTSSCLTIEIATQGNCGNIMQASPEQAVSLLKKMSYK